jgi:hypothetical protein
MGHRQLVIFRIGCWAAILTAALQAYVHVRPPSAPQSEEHRILMDTAESLQFELPGGGSRSLMELMRGYGLSFTVLLAVVGGSGLMIAKRGRTDEILMLGVARVFAAGGVALLVISYTHWYIIPTMCIAFFALCFALASVRPPK